MARLSSSMMVLAFAAVVALVLLRPVAASDPDITTDFGINVTSGADLHYTAFRDLPDQPKGSVKIAFGFDKQFPAVTGLGIAPAFIKFGPKSTNPFHSHPRGSEVFYILDGELDAGIVDTANNLYTATLKKGDVFVFPKGLMHYQLNRQNTGATVLAVFNSENAGRVSLGPALFNSNPRIDPEALIEGLFLDRATVDRLQAFQFPTVS